MEKKLGKGSISLVLLIAAIVWSSNIHNICIGDRVLTYMGVPTWSNGTFGIHYTIYYSFLLLIPAIVVGAKNKEDLFSKEGRYGSIAFLTILFIIGLLFLIINM